MTAGEFEAAYAERSGVSVEWLHLHGRFAEPCDCGDGMCEGWAMGHQQEDAIVERRLRNANCDLGIEVPSWQQEFGPSMVEEPDGYGCER